MASQGLQNRRNFLRNSALLVLAAPAISAQPFRISSVVDDVRNAPDLVTACGILQKHQDEILKEARPGFDIHDRNQLTDILRDKFVAFFATLGIKASAEEIDGHLPELNERLLQQKLILIPGYTAAPNNTTLIDIQLIRIVEGSEFNYQEIVFTPAVKTPKGRMHVLRAGERVAGVYTAVFVGRELEQLFVKEPTIIVSPKEIKIFAQRFGINEQQAEMWTLANEAGHHLFTTLVPNIGALAMEPFVIRTNESPQPIHATALQINELCSDLSSLLHNPDVSFDVYFRYQGNMPPKSSPNYELCKQVTIAAAFHAKLGHFPANMDELRREFPAIINEMNDSSSPIRVKAREIFIKMSREIIGNFVLSLNPIIRP